MAASHLQQLQRNDEMEKYFMRQALCVARTALDIGEVPVGCVIVLRDISDVDPSLPSASTNLIGDHEEIVPYMASHSVIVSHGANQVNATRDATRHAEIVAIDRMLTKGRSSDQLKLPPEVICKSAHGKVPEVYISGMKDDYWVNIQSCENHWKNAFGWGSGRVYDKQIFANCDLYVTCEPCIMVRWRSD
jgi:tRNA(Arg) A34 adenosine deaminase TadA